MATFTLRTRTGSRGLPLPAVPSIPRPAATGVIIVGALLAFEAFNFSTTEFALRDVLGELSFSGVRWATILALAFCGMDFAGVTRIFAPTRTKKLSLEVWYLLGAWLLAATMNAMLTWWAVSLALLEHQGLGNQILGRETLTTTAPIFVALLVWLIRILMIGTFTLSGGRILQGGSGKSAARAGTATQTSSGQASRRGAKAAASRQRAPRPAPKPEPPREAIINP